MQQHRDGQLNSVPRPKSRAASLEQDCVRCIPLNPTHPARRSRKASWGCAAAQNWQPDFEESPLTGGLSSNLEQAVPAEQRPVNELAALREAALYSWVSIVSSAPCQTRFVPSSSRAEQHALGRV